LNLDSFTAFNQGEKSPKTVPNWISNARKKIVSTDRLIVTAMGEVQLMLRAFATRANRKPPLSVNVSHSSINLLTQKMARLIDLKRVLEKRVREPIMRDQIDRHWVAFDLQ